MHRSGLNPQGSSGERDFRRWMAPIAIIFTIVWAGMTHAAELKIATISPEGSSWMEKMRQGAEEVSRKTENRVRFKFYPGGVMGDDKAVLRKIRIGQLHGGAVISGSLSQFYPDSQVYGYPMLFRSYEEVDYVRQRMDPLLMEGFEKGGFVTFGLAEGGFAYVMSRQPIRSIEDMQKQKFWVPDNDISSVELVRSFGVAPIPLPLSDVLTALQTGLIDTVGVSPIGALALQWHTQVNYVTDLPLLYIYGILAVKRDFFEKILPADQALVREIMGRAFREIDRQNRLDNVMAMEALKKQGVEVISLAPGKLEAFRTRSAEAIEQMIAMNKISSNIYQILEKHLADFRASHGRQ